MWDFMDGHHLLIILVMVTQDLVWEHKLAEDTFSQTVLESILNLVEGMLFLAENSELQ